MIPVEVEYNTPKLMYGDVVLGIVTFPESLALRQEMCVASPVTVPRISSGPFCQESADEMASAINATKG